MTMGRSEDMTDPGRPASAGRGGARRHGPAQELSAAGRLPGPGSLWVLAGVTSP